MRDANRLNLDLTSRIGKIRPNLSVRTLVRVLILILSLIGVIVEIVAAHRAKTLAITLAGILRFELCLLSRRDKMGVLFQILDDFFSDNFAFETAQRALNRFVIVN
jgi:hypothetical protein